MAKKDNIKEKKPISYDKTKEKKFPQIQADDDSFKRYVTYRTRDV